MGCLNDITLGVRDGTDTLRPREIAAAQEVSNYTKQFPFGQIAWVGPGDEKVWSYNIPFKQGYGQGCWDRQATAFMDILKQSGHIFLNPCFHTTLYNNK